MIGPLPPLTGWSQAEAVGRPLSEVFHVVNEHTGELVENPALQALREGRVVELDPEVTGFAGNEWLVSKRREQGLRLSRQRRHVDTMRATEAIVDVRW